MQLSYRLLKDRLNFEKLDSGAVRRVGLFGSGAGRRLSLVGLTGLEATRITNEEPT